jgi:N6-L-threonylcarbamoyladenine synthase
MVASDLDAVLAIERESFSDAWTVGMFAEELEAPSRALIVAEKDGIVVGYAVVMVIEGEAHLMNLAVRAEWRGQGIGHALAVHALECAAGLGAQLITLEVRPGNAAAIRLYERLGMRAVGRRPHYYLDTGEDALIMWGEVPQPPVAAIESGAGRGATGGVAREGGTDGDGGTDRELLLAIESSCDETAAAVMRGGRELVANIVASQVDFHARFGGVVPEIASRKHTEAVVGVVAEAMERAGQQLGLGRALAFSELDGIAVTYGPGLVGALVVGLAYAKGLAFATGLPLVGVNHLEGHIFANVLADPELKPPLIALVVSGGHTSLVHMPEWGVYRTMGETLDDAAGEAFDKVAKVLGLGYPGGPVLSKLAEEGNPAAIDFPRAMMRSGDYSFSLSGLKTAVINHIRHERDADHEIDLADLSASFQAAVIDVQVAKAIRAVEETGATAFCLAGGVAANSALRREITAAMESRGVHVSVPPLHLCTDNAAMIAAAAHYRWLRGDLLGMDADPVPGLRLDTQ